MQIESNQLEEVKVEKLVDALRPKGRGLRADFFNQALDAVVKTVHENKLMLVRVLPAKPPEAKPSA